MKMKRIIEIEADTMDDYRYALYELALHIENEAFYEGEKRIPIFSFLGDLPKEEWTEKNFRITIRQGLEKSEELLRQKVREAGGDLSYWMRVILEFIEVNGSANYRDLVNMFGRPTTVQMCIDKLIERKLLKFRDANMTYYPTWVERK
jgi:hypothetical protein